ncbi:hypothetical protein BDV38DRAFT_76951 [Aspergillus pseudotamarii]|uniref:Secreted protein n=1 Tax=Aspergillus pseudotamarii TaxID=132259 RepID=A0A5N6STR0_ASPPS|nr:uncharacterized protein BDV38DRAFT_76951 [Aspergillus pseudotamarii]KAE8138025.1 hypothetical protein BDV38DRAFT_76951 [Aspergillus pseudotamarii]
MDRGGYIVFLILLSTMEWVSDRANCSPARFHLDAAKLIQLEADRSPTGATLISHLYVSSHSSSLTLFSWCYGSERRICDYSALCDFLFFFPLAFWREPFNTRFLCVRLHIVALPSSFFRPSRPLSPLAASMLSVHCGWFFDGNINDMAEGRLASDGRVLAFQPAVTYLQSI